MKPPRDYRQAESLRFYKSARWKKFRLAFLRNEPLCRRCGMPATTLHHIQELIDRPDLALDPANMEPLCHPCHRRHHNGTVGPSRRAPYIDGEKPNDGLKTFWGRE